MMCLVDIQYIQMAKLLLLLVFVCFQFSNQVEAADDKTPVNQFRNQKIQLPVEKTEILDGEDEKQWQKKVKDNFEVEKKHIEEEYKNWLPLLTENSSDDGDDYDDYNDRELEAIEDIITDIEDYLQKTNNESRNYKWLLDILEWLEVLRNGFNKDWLLKTNTKTKRALPRKRFWSV